jgi:hypothetical protein
MFVYIQFCTICNTKSGSFVNFWNGSIVIFVSCSILYKKPVDVYLIAMFLVSSEEVDFEEDDVS